MGIPDVHVVLIYHRPSELIRLVAEFEGLKPATHIAHLIPGGNDGFL